MPQLNFNYNYPYPAVDSMTVNAGTLTFVAFNVWDSISLNTINLLVNIASNSQSTRTISASLGLYTLTGSTLSIANSISGSITIRTSDGSVRLYMSLIDVSATSNLTPGTYFWGFLLSSSGGGNVFMLAHTNDLNPANAFPGGFIGGAMTNSTSVLPSSVATSDLDVTGQDAMSVPYLIISA